MTRVSIILSNLNTSLLFLKERVNSIVSQTYKDWECIIIDGYSDNGSWEYLSEIAARDNRFTAYQYKKEGIYKAWNTGIELAKSDYIYIAPSDDTMTNDCIEELINALEDYPDCDIAHCSLSIIDENGKNASNRAAWDQFYPSLYFGSLMEKKHIRLAPHDGILHCSLKTVYTSITQLLIRKSLFTKVGNFLIDQGSIADFEWGMRASLVANTIHIPQYLASWRIHHLQATTDNIQVNIETYKQLRDLIDHAFNVTIQKGLLSKKFYKKSLKSIYWKNEYDLAMAKAGGKKAKFVTFLKYFLNQPIILAKLISLSIIFGEKFNNISFIKSQVKSLGLDKTIRIL